MEYPMITCIGGQRDSLSLYSVLVHETGHMWFPMMVGSNETRHSWQDEGLTTFNQNQGMAAYFPGLDRWPETLMGYTVLATGDDEIELMRHGDLYPRGSPAFGMASYDKMALILHALRGLLGDDTFLRAYREYGRRWLGRHPVPYDFFNTFNDVSGQDLSWFWRTWFYETWTLDQAVAGVVLSGGEAEVTIEDRGLAPMPVRLAVTRDDGTVERYEAPVAVWLNGARRQTVRVPRAASIARVEIDPEHWFPDVALGNNVWRR
jgi:aminopeptidase N